VHQLIAETLYDSTSDADAVAALTTIAEGDVVKEINRRHEAEMQKLAKLERKGYKRRIKRTPEEIKELRAERAAKRARLNLPAHVNGPSRWADTMEGAPRQV